jgi:hypothetical protein
MRQILFVMSTCVLLGASLVAQGVPNDSSDLNPGSGGLSRGAQEQHDRIYREQAKKRLDSLKTDTDRLAQLSQELKKSVDNVNPDAMLSVDVIKKADEIAKLAKKVSEKMKGQ